ncbi:unnamed protein product, partial [Ectocarpus sp. 12 AP-2014]
MATAASAATAAATAAANAASEAEGEECPLAAIFYAEFDDNEGGKILHQYPPEKFTRAHCKMLSSRIICDKDFCEKVSIVDSMAIPWTLASFPSSIGNEKVQQPWLRHYKRNVLRFNVSFVFKKGHAQAPVVPYDRDPFIKVLERFGWWLREMELRFGYLKSGGEVNKVRLQELLERAYKGLKTDRRALLMLTGPGCTSLMPLLQPYVAATPLKDWRKIQDHDVPARRCPGLVESVSATASELAMDPDAVWGPEVDLVVQQVLPHVNGVKHVKKISRDSQVEIAAVKAALRWVLYTNQILLTDVFRYSNIYVQTTTTAEYTKRKDFRMACWERIAKPVVAASVADNVSSAGGDAEGMYEGPVSQQHEEAPNTERGPAGGGWTLGDGTSSSTAATPRAAPAESDWGAVEGDGAGGGGGAGIEAETGTIPEAPHPACLRRLYGSFQCDRSVMDVLKIAEGPEGFVEQFDHRRMCAFGVEVGILRRLHCAPHCVRAEGKEAAARREEVDRASHPRRSLGGRFDLEYVQRLMNGRRTEDALCCFLSCSPK